MSIKVTPITYNDGSKPPHKRAGRDKSPHSGVTDFGDLCKFAPYEGGYCFIVVFDQPRIGINKDLQDLFVDAIERDFRGLSGINDKTGEGHEYGPSTAPINMISKVEGMGNTTVTMTLTEATGTPITTYIGAYLDRIRNPYSQIRSYGGKIGIGDGEIDAYDVGFKREVFNMLYIITDSTCMLVEKAFYLLNAQPINASYSDLYNVNKGDISTKEININFNCTVREGRAANITAQSYINVLINQVSRKLPNYNGLVNLNSYDYSYSISGLKGEIGNLNDLHLTKKGKFSYKGNKTKISELVSSSNYVKWDPYGDQPTTGEAVNIVDNK